MNDKPIIDSRDAEIEALRLELLTQKQVVRDFLHDGENLKRTIAALRAEVERLRAEITVPRIPEPERIESMCYRYDHGHGMLGWRESPEQHRRRQERNRTIMRQLYEEATGQGFYSEATRGRYAPGGALGPDAAIKESQP